jgi:hypothetical protein
MGLDLHFRGTNSELVPTGNVLQPYEPLKIEYDDFFTLNDHISECSWSEGFTILNAAPVKVEEDGSNNFTWNTGIYTYEQIMKHLSDTKVSRFLIEQIKKKLYTKYIHIQIY